MNTRSAKRVYLTSSRATDETESDESTEDERTETDSRTETDDGETEDEQWNCLNGPAEPTTSAADSERSMGISTFWNNTEKTASKHRRGANSNGLAVQHQRSRRHEFEASLKSWESRLGRAVPEDLKESWTSTKEQLYADPFIAKAAQALSIDHDRRIMEHFDTIDSGADLLRAHHLQFFILADEFETWKQQSMDLVYTHFNNNRSTHNGHDHGHDHNYNISRANAKTRTREGYACLWKPRVFEGNPGENDNVRKRRIHMNKGIECPAHIWYEVQTRMRPYDPPIDVFNVTYRYQHSHSHSWAWNDGAKMSTLNNPRNGKKRIIKEEQVDVPLQMPISVYWKQQPEFTPRTRGATGTYGPASMHAGRSQRILKSRCAPEISVVPFREPPMVTWKQQHEQQQQQQKGGDSIVDSYDVNDNYVAQNTGRTVPGPIPDMHTMLERFRRLVPSKEDLVELFAVLEDWESRLPRVGDDDAGPKKRKLRKE
ncbi:hypothetical protein BGZ51_008646 [Haplosporangium sp. Z 767]|nr:hypothetical protein BGZ50_003546 [Haplosporangium sp. Z 11]KAF9190460.1 hypothetical protein BGZ51_008646 [Haplosporangium sp. Z 767]